jgi:hypothetical protein
MAKKKEMHPASSGTRPEHSSPNWATKNFSKTSNFSIRLVTVAWTPLRIW